ncbi:hypothetical protein PRIPAC_73356 [Pristionchus pacificus]|uniref:Uncharacterized protein n=1 Tax=Pristionchus pacificus TaxID=54126 RepID=A0A2A6CZT6_PRIPA|nr:hypothetical protein PRIPAC_73356 [Pristionchus pacificus]|eukprot:PDM83541.1 hypothetical protein PRIPAC_30028 [Pristionchus pacificus]
MVIYFIARALARAMRVGAFTVHGRDETKRRSIEGRQRLMIMQLACVRPWVTISPSNFLEYLEDNGT